MVMSRKARLTVFRDKLEAVSDCPSTIFNNFEPSDSDFELIARAEGGDVAAIEAISERLYAIYGTEIEENDALLYFLILGLEKKSPLCAMLLIELIDKYNTHFRDLDAATTLIEGTEAEEKLAEVVSRARLKAVIAAPSLKCDFIAPDNSPYEGYLELYIAGKAHACGREYDAEKARETASRLKLGGLLDLALFGGKGEDIGECDEKAIKGAMHAFDMYEWSDFWLCAAYEYVAACRGGDLTPYAVDMLSAVSRRPDYPKKELHELALKKYVAECGHGYTKEEIEALERRCRFNGLPTEEDVNSLIKEAIYVESAPRKCGVHSVSYDAEIQHERNRYTLTMTLTDHKKRASRHQWEAVVAIKTDEDVPPTFEPVPIVDCLAKISRNGITLEKEKKAAQVLCAGEIRIGEKVSPFELDLILDISYVSATKCTHCAFKVERYKRQGEYLIIQTDISLYANN